MNKTEYLEYCNQMYAKGTPIVPDEVYDRLVENTELENTEDIDIVSSSHFGPDDESEDGERGDLDSTTCRRRPCADKHQHGDEEQRGLLKATDINGGKPCGAWCRALEPRGEKFLPDVERPEC